MPFSNSSFLVWKKKKKQATVKVDTDAYKVAFISTNGHARCRGTILLFSISLA